MNEKDVQAAIDGVLAGLGELNAEQRKVFGDFAEKLTKSADRMGGVDRKSTRRAKNP